MLLVRLLKFLDLDKATQRSFAEKCTRSEILPALLKTFKLFSPCAPNVSTIFQSLKFALLCLKFATFFMQPKSHCDVIHVFDPVINMAEKGKKQKPGKFCATGGPTK